MWFRISRRWELIGEAEPKDNDDAILSFDTIADAHFKLQTKPTWVLLPEGHGSSWMKLTSFRKGPFLGAEAKTICIMYTKEATLKIMRAIALNNGDENKDSSPSDQRWRDNVTKP